MIQSHDKYKSHGISQDHAQSTLNFSSWAASDFSKFSCFFISAATLSSESPTSSLARKDWGRESDVGRDRTTVLWNDVMLYTNQHRKVKVAAE